jgi:putative transposase
VRQILHAADIDPAPRHSHPTCREFLTAQAEGIIAADFLSSVCDSVARFFGMC